MHSVKQSTKCSLDGYNQIRGGPIFNLIFVDVIL